MGEHSVNQPIEESLRAHFQAPAPSHAFIERLEQRLMQAEPETDGMPSIQKHRKPAFRFAFAGLVLLLVVTVLAAGPDRVLAALQDLWQRYIPGFGEVQSSGLRKMEEPVEREENGVTFRVEEFVASRDGTYVNIKITGLAEGASVHPDSIVVDWPGGHRLGLSTVFTQPIPVGSDPEAGDQGSTNHRGTSLRYEFEPLPLDVKSARVTWNVAGLVPETSVAEQWSLRVQLEPESAETGNQFGQLAYSPQITVDQQVPFELDVSSVYQISDMTVVHVEAHLPVKSRADWYFGISILNPVLVDDRGRHYYTIPPVPDLRGIAPSEPIQSLPDEIPGTVLRDTQLFFEAIPVSVNELVLQVPYVEYRVQADQFIEIDIPGDAVVGDSFPANQTIDLKGLPVLIQDVEIVTGLAAYPYQGTPDKREDHLFLQFDIHVPLSDHGKEIAEVQFLGTGPWWDANPYRDDESGALLWRASYAPERNWRDSYRIRIPTIVVRQEGNWRLRWEVPRD